MADTTTIQVPEEMADELHGLKERGDTYADVIARLLEDASSGTGSASVQEVVEDWYPGQDVEQRERRREMGTEILTWLQERGSATRSEFVDELYSEGTGIEADSWWRRVGLPVLKKARDQGLVEYREGSKVWSWSE